MLLLAVGCSPAEPVGMSAAGSGPGAGSPPLLLDLMGAPGQVRVAGTQIALAAEAWLDRMPRVVAEGETPPGPLQVRVRLATEPGVPKPMLELERVWVISGESVWDARPRDVRRVDGAVEAMIGGGPAPQPGLPLDVAVRFKGADGARHHLKVRIGVQSVF
ncbi:MAG: hypothetical protein ACE5FN_00985 [Leptospirillia bacterium]